MLKNFTPLIPSAFYHLYVTKLLNHLLLRIDGRMSHFFLNSHTQHIDGICKVKAMIGNDMLEVKSKIDVAC